VIAFRRSNDVLTRLQGALDLAPLELEIAFTIHAGVMPPAITWTPGRLFHVMENAQRNDTFFHRVSKADLNTIAMIHSALEAHDKRLIDVGLLTRQLSELKALPHASPLRFLGYFALLESLLTHAPKPSDPYDSITRQVKKKVTLLDHRWARPIDYGPFGNASADTVWSKMYAYRSLLAHGSAPAFTGDLQVLRSHEHALRLVKETVKSIIRQALEEPRLLRDLKEC
jgi:hypothetical protein